MNGYAVAGICLIRVGSMRPRGLPARIGLGSENAAHRFAVEWDTPSGVDSGVYIPRRDSDSLVNLAVGGHLYPGAHHRATFAVNETESKMAVRFTARDASAHVEIVARITDDLVGSKLFANTAEASAFFEHGSVGFSATSDPRRFDGLALATSAWRVEPGEVMKARASYFADRSAFPAGTAELDSVLVMRRVPVTWKPLALLTTTGPENKRRIGILLRSCRSADHRPLGSSAGLASL